MCYNFVVRTYVLQCRKAYYGINSGTTKHTNLVLDDYSTE